MDTGWESDDEGEMSGSDQMDVASVSSISSYEVDSMRSSSSSVMSIESVTQFFRGENGRLFNTKSNIYRLPADEEELDRQDKQHAILGSLMGYKYVPGMHEVMTDDDPNGEPKTCLDLGSGSGKWIFEVAADFPRCRGVAVDLIPLKESILPLNVRSEVDEINYGLHHYFDSFHMVHTRLIASGIRDYHRLINQIARVTHPGGLIDLTEYDFRIYDFEGKLMNVDLENYKPPWNARWMAHLRDAIYRKGGDTSAAENLKKWVKANPALEAVGVREHFLPVVPPPGSLGSLEPKMKTIVMSFVQASRTLLLEMGTPPDYLMNLEAKLEEEIDKKEIIQFTRLQCVFARRRLDYVFPN